MKDLGQVRGEPYIYLVGVRKVAAPSVFWMDWTLIRAKWRIIMTKKDCHDIVRASEEKKIPFIRVTLLSAPPLAYASKYVYGGAMLNSAK